MTAPDDTEDLAGEYVLGTLDLGQRRAVAARRQREPKLDAAILAWEKRLGPLAEAAPGIAPPPGLWEGIEDALKAGPGVAAVSRSLTRWKVTAFASSAVAACLALALGAQFALAPRLPQNFVAVLQKDAASPAFIVTVDIASRALTVRPVSAAQPQGKSYELWLVNKTLPNPKSLGLIQNASFTTTSSLQQYPAAVVRDSVLAVSLEPEGGSTTGLPTGPVVFSGQLVQATP